jgi:cytoskeletal protein CcmA (bactofilin family)
MAKSYGDVRQAQRQQANHPRNRRGQGAPACPRSEHGSRRQLPESCHDRQRNQHREGVIEGRSVQSAQDIEVAESGKVVASIEARVVRIGGEVTGDISGAEKVMIMKSGRVLGNIVAPRVQLEDGSLFRGSIDMTPVPVAEVKPTADKSAGGDVAARKPATVAAAQQPDNAAGARKEPGLTLKSG